MYPSQIVSLKAFPGADNTIALPDHGDRIEIVFVGLRPGGHGRLGHHRARLRAVARAAGASS